MTDHVANLDKENQTNKMVNESLTAELERYKERVAIFEQRLNVDLNKREKLIDSQIVIAKEHDVISVIDDGETLILEEDKIVHIAVNSVDILNVNKSCVDECNKCLELETELLKKKDLIEKDLFEINELKAQSQEKDTVIRKLKDMIKSLSGKDSVENVKKDIDEIETIHIELEHNQFDSIRKTRVQSKEHCASLIAQINAKSVENSDLNTQLQEKIFAIAALKNELRKLKGKNVVDTAISKPLSTIAPRMFKLDIDTISHRLKNNRDAHEVYLEKTIENTNTLRRLELLVYVSKACPSLTKPCEKLVSITSMNKDKKVRFVEPVTSSSNIPKQTDSLRTKNSNKPLLTSTVVNTTTSASGSKLSGNTNKNRISRPPSSNQKNKVEEHPRKVKSSLNKMNFVFEPISNTRVKHSVKNAKFESICAICNKCLFDANHDMCVIDYVNDVNVRRTFTIVENKCPLTRFTSTKVVPAKETTNKSVPTPTQGVIVYSRRSKAPKLVVQIVLCKKHSYKSKAEDFIQEKLYLLHMDLSGPMRIQSINGRKYILVIDDDYSRTDNGTKFVNQTLRAYYEEVGISHQTSVSRTSQQNGIVERWNRTLVEAARTMLIFLKASLVLWAEAVATAYYTQNRSLIQKCHNKTPYELLHDRKPDLSYLHVFGALCHPTNDSEYLGMLKPKADIGIFVGYAPAKKAFRIYNKRTRLIIETIHVDLDKLTAMASEQFSSGLGYKHLTHGTISSGLVQNIPSSTPYVLPTKNEWEILFQPMFDEYLNPSPCVDP
ncbi:retrovirus-related pol polyprotein from transposon TNT 1-94 [Tanacetum coccineum]